MTTPREEHRNGWTQFVSGLSREDLESLHGACLHRMLEEPAKYPHEFTGRESATDTFVKRALKRKGLR